MGLTRREVEKVSLLGRLELSDAELAQMTEQLGQIVDYMALLSELNTDGVEPLSHALDVSNVFRDDEPRPSLSCKDALANAPRHDGQFYLVPAVLGE